MFEKYIGPFSEKNGCFGAMDDLGRVLPNDNETSDVRKDRKVGIFYFLWIGEHGTDGPYDISAIVKAHPRAIESEENWYAAGGGPRGNHHFWGKPLFGYYRSSDDWVMRKHLQMLTDAGVDFIVFDTTNGPTYDERMQQIIAIWYEYLEKGVDVPKMSFYTNSASGQTMEHIFKNIYKNKELHDKYPRLEELWFKHDGKPMIIGIEAEASQEIKEFFTFKESVWPNAGRCDNGFPWMEFERALKPESVYGRNGRKEVIETARELNREKNVTVILITHYMDEVVHADKIYVMDEGKVVMEGTPKEIFSRVKELKKLRLDVPQVTELAYELKKAGLEMPDGVLTIDEFVDAITLMQFKDGFGIYIGFTCACFHLDIQV